MNVCPFCGEPVPYGHRCTCKQSRSLFAKELFEKHYGKGVEHAKDDINERLGNSTPSLRKRRKNVR